MTLTVAKNGRWRLVGTPDEFADVISYTDYIDLEDLKSGIASTIEGTTVKFKDHRGWYEMSGSRADLAEIFGTPEARTVAETIDTFASLCPSVRILSA